MQGQNPQPWETALGQAILEILQEQDTKSMAPSTLHRATAEKVGSTPAEAREMCRRLYVARSIDISASCMYRIPLHIQKKTARAV